MGTIRKDGNTLYKVPTPVESKTQSIVSLQMIVQLMGSLGFTETTLGDLFVEAALL